MQHGPFVIVSEDLNIGLGYLWMIVGTLLAQIGGTLLVISDN